MGGDQIWSFERRWNKRHNARMENVLEPFYIPMESFIQWINSRKKTDKKCRNANKKRNIRWTERSLHTIIWNVFMPPIEQSIKTINNEDQLFSLQRLWQELKWSAFIFCFGWCEAFLRTSKNIQRNDSLPGVSRKWRAGASGFPLDCWLKTPVQTMEFLEDWETHSQVIFLKCGQTRCF